MWFGGNESHRAKDVVRKGCSQRVCEYKAATNLFPVATKRSRREKNTLRRRKRVKDLSPASRGFVMSLVHQDRVEKVFWRRRYAVIDGAHGVRRGYYQVE